MNTWISVLIALCVVLLGLGLGAALVNRVRELDKAWERHVDTVNKSLASAATEVFELKRRIEAMEQEMKELPTAQMEEEYQRLANFNDGIQNILSFGPDVPRLNKEVLKHE